MKKVVYMDAAASWLKPQSVIESEVDFLTNNYANAGRGICERAGKVDDLIAESRVKIANFIGADSTNIVWTYGTTDSMNRIVDIVTKTLPNKHPTIVVSDLDHHSSRLPWEMYAKDNNCKIITMPLDENFNIDTKTIPDGDIYVITAMSNVMGAAQDVSSIIGVIRSKNKQAITIVDAAQYVVHAKIDVKKFDCDFLAFSGHKIGADTGVGVMYIKNPDYWNVDKFGGGMVNKIIDKENIILNKSPEKYEAGTLPLTQIIGLSKAIEYLSNWNGGNDLISFMYDELSKIKNIKLVTSKDSSLITFVVKNMHVLDFGALIGMQNICIRVGNMCATWIHKKLNIDGSIRISVGPWNTMDDAKYVIEKIKKIVE
nr:aminotransferase class V-fold PLP-dependent enzyme [Candidatus Enterousia merdequi]